MSEIAVRADTHIPGPPSWLFERSRNPSPSFRQFNATQYEPWLRRAYAPTVKPFFVGPERNYLKYSSDFGVSIRTDLLQLTQGLASKKLPWWMEQDFFPSVMSKWHDHSMTEREELLLLVWERQHRRAEEKGFLLRRVECPELVLDFAKDPFEFQLLMQSIIFDRRTDTQYRLPRNAAWERLNDATKSSLPPSRAVRAFTEDARLARALFLAQFVVELLKALVGMPEKERYIIGKGTAPTAEEMELVAASQNPHKGVAIRVNSGRGVRICSECMKPAKDGIKYLFCSKCQAARIETAYCSAACQKAAWPTHKHRCGRSASDPDLLPRAKSAPTYLQLKHLEWLETYPRVVWASKAQFSAGKDGKFGNLEEHFLPLPPFVQPFLPTLSLFTDIRNKASKEKDDFSIGVVALYVRHAHPYSTTEARDWPSVRSHRQLLAILLELDEGEVERCAQVAEEKLGEADPLIVSCFEQLDAKRADSQTLRMPRLINFTSPFLDSLLSHPLSLIRLIFSPNDSKPKTMLLREQLTHFDLALSSIRTAGFAALTSFGADRDALGTWLLFACANFPLVAKEGVMRLDLWWKREVFAILEREWGIEKGRCRRAVEAAEAALRERKDDEGEMLTTTLEELRALKRVRDEPAPALPLAVNVETAGDDPSASVDELGVQLATTSLGAKKRNKKKKKQKTAAIAGEAEVNGVE